MPEICRFFGIVIKMFFDDHAPPHFHVEYDEYRAVIDIRSLATIGGHLPPRAAGMVVEWAARRAEELLELWETAAAKQPLRRLPPLE